MESSDATPPATIGFNDRMRNTLLLVGRGEPANPIQVRALLRRGLVEGSDRQPVLTAKGNVVLDAIDAGRSNEEIRKLF